MRNRILNIFAIACGLAGVALGAISLMFAGTGIMRISDGFAAAISSVLAVFYGLTAFLYVRAYISYRKSPDISNATDILVGIAFIVWISLSAWPSFPDAVPLFDYFIPKSIFLLVASYAFYRLSKFALIRNEN